MAFNFNVTSFSTRISRAGSALILGLFLALITSHRMAIPQEQPAMAFEFQFTDGFSGQTVAIRAEGETRAEFVAQTKFQTGLAHIEMLDLPDGKEVTVTIGDTDIELHLDVDATRPFIIFTLRDGALTATMSATQPGYL